MRTLTLTSFVLIAFAIGLPAQTAHSLFSGYAIIPAPLIPPTGSGSTPQSASNTTVQPFNFVHSQPGLVDSVSVQLDITHTYVADLVISVEHCGVTCVLSDGVNGIYSGSENLGGGYVFADGNAVPFDSAPVTGSGTAAVITPGFYAPDNSLNAAFAGLPWAGRWEVRIWDGAAGDTGTLISAGIGVTLRGGKDEDNGINLNVPTTGSSGVTTHTFTIADAGRVGQVALDLNLSHTYAADLDFKLTHNGTTLSFFNGDTTGVFGSDFGGLYRFRETEGAPPLSGAAIVSGTLAPGTYQLGGALNAFEGMEMSGEWTLTITDDAGGDVGVLADARLYVVREGFTVAVTQPNAPNDVTVAFSNGSRQGNNYFKPYTLVPGTFPNGWFYGLDTDLGLLLALWTLPPNFPTISGTLDACVSDSATLFGPVPTGIPFQMVTLEFNAPGSPISQPGRLAQRSNPLSYVTQ